MLTYTPAAASTGGSPPAKNDGGRLATKIRKVGGADRSVGGGRCAEDPVVAVNELGILVHIALLSQRTTRGPPLL